MTLNGRKQGIALGDQKKDLGQTSNWSKLVAAYLPVARVTVLERLVTYGILWDRFLMDDEDSANHNSFVPSQSFTDALQQKFLKARTNVVKSKVLNGTKTSFRRALISNNYHLC